MKFIYLLTNGSYNYKRLLSISYIGILSLYFNSEQIIFICRRKCNIQLYFKIKSKTMKNDVNTFLAILS
jgi:hypothetical protein